MKRNVFLLAACQALLNTSTSLLIATSALVGLALAPMAALSTVPLGLQFLAMMTATIPASLLMKRQGRRVGFLAGCVVGVSGGVICSVAIHTSSFVLFCVGSALLGVFNGVGQYYRFTAADVASAEYRSRAISLVMAGGVVAAFAGPNLANVTREMVSPFAFTGSYASLVLLYLASMALIAFMRIPAPSPEERAGVGRPLVEIVRQPSFVIAALGGMVSYGVMSVLMTATPLAMAGCGFAFSEAAWVIQWHVFGMFAPSFFTGHVIRRFGATKVVVVGGLLMFACALVSFAYTDIYSRDVLRGVLLPLLDAVLVLWFLGVGLAWRYRRRTDAGEHADRLFR